MAVPRRGIEQAFTERELADLERIARSRTEPASRFGRKADPDRRYLLEVLASLAALQLGRLWPLAWRWSLVSQLCDAISGFYRFGYITIFVTIMIFVTTLYGPRWQIFVAAAVILFTGLSLWVAYLVHRPQILIWGRHSFELRLVAFDATPESVAPFDLGNPLHRRAVDLRRNQNQLVGAAPNFVPTYKDFADGQTAIAAISALIPRALWPDKPVASGSQFIREYTGIEFDENTSVDVGRVIQYYTNYGWTGLAVCFFLFGIILWMIDFRGAGSLVTESWGDLALWFPVGASMLQPLGSLVDISSSAAAAAIIGAIVTRWSRGSRLGAAPAANVAKTRT